MEININDVVSNVRTVDSDSLLSPEVLQKIVNTVLVVVEKQEGHSRDVRSEQRVTGGVRDDLEEEWT